MSLSVSTTPRTPNLQKPQPEVLFCKYIFLTFFFCFFFQLVGEQYKIEGLEQQEKVFIFDKLLVCWLFVLCVTIVAFSLLVQSLFSNINTADMAC